jgi:hypothetical protein
LTKGNLEWAAGNKPFQNIPHSAMQGLGFELLYCIGCAGWFKAAGGWA